MAKLSEDSKGTKDFTKKQIDLEEQRNTREKEQLARQKVEDSVGRGDNLPSLEEKKEKDQKPTS